MPGQRVSQKARMLVTNQVKRVTTPFSFPIGTRAERSWHILATTLPWQKIYQHNGHQGKPCDAKVFTATLTFDCPDHLIAWRCSRLPGYQQAQAHSTTANTIWKCCTEAGECVPRLPQRLCLATQYWLLLILWGGKTTLKVKNTFTTYSVSSALASVCVCLCHYAGMGSGIHYKGE